MTHEFKKLIKGQRVRDRDREQIEKYLNRVIADSRLTEEHKTLLEIFCNQYRTKKGKQLTKSTLSNYMVCIREYFIKNPYPVQDVTREKLDRFFNQLTISERTIHSYRIIIRLFFQ